MNKKVKVALGILGGGFASYCLIALGYNAHMKKTNPKPSKHSYSEQTYTIK